MSRSPSQKGDQTTPEGSREQGMCRAARTAALEFEAVVRELREQHDHFLAQVPEATDDLVFSE